jgi:uncharacterized protein YdhG (YjbR/CyaY superfamily)
MRDLIKFRTVDEYLRIQSPPVAKMLGQLRAAIKDAATGAEETIAYNMPAFRLEGPLVYFAAAQQHIGFYPMPSATEAFKGELSKFDCSKGTIRFALDEPLPVALIKKIVRFRVKENLEKAKLKAATKKPKKIKGPSTAELPVLAAPARRALLSKKISKLDQLTRFSEKEIAQLHGMGPSALATLKAALMAQGLQFKK